MDQTFTALPYHALATSYVLAIFDDAADNGDKDGDAAADQGGAASSDRSASAGKADGKADAQADGRSQQRDRSGRFAIPNTEDAGELRRALVAAQERIGELNSENTKHRLRANALEGRLNSADQRVIRAETRDALSQAGAISPRIVDLFLADNADKVKIDAKTGEPIGIRENIEVWKSANADFFKPAMGANKDADQQKDAGADSGKGDSGAADGSKDDAKPNRTGTGASTRGAASDNGNSGGMPDLRGLTPKQRAEAVRSYQQSLRGSRGG